MKEKLKSCLEFLKKPSKTFSLICYLLFVAFSISAIILACLNHQSVVLYILFGGMGVTFFYCLYLFITFDYKKVRDFHKKTKDKLASKSKFLNKLFFDIYFRTLLSTSISLFLGICFVCYNAFAGIYYHSVWHGSISVYYGLLVLIKIITLSSEYNLNHKKDFTDADKGLRRAKMFKFEGICLLCVNIALIAPVSLLALSQKDVNLPMWIAIANACYAFYKIIGCTYSFIKTRKNTNLTIIGIKNLNLTSACITILSLENTLIITFSDNIESGIQIMMILSALAVMIINMSIAISTLIKGNKQVKVILSN